MAHGNFALVAAAALASSLGCLWLHYEALRILSFLLPHIALRPRQKMLVVVAGALLAHLIEIVLFALAFFAGYVVDGTDTDLPAAFAQSLYVSIESYASLGTSTGYPAGPVHLLAGTEALVGLILIGWTASYTYLAMCKFWEEH